MDLVERPAMWLKDTRLRLILFAAFIIQVVVCITAIGIYHPDQYFQIIEFSSHQLNRASAVGHVWEFAAQLRPTLQVYLFSAYYELCSGLGIQDPYLQLELLRLLFGLALFVFFNGLTLWYFRREDRRILYFILLLLNFSWILPYTRTLYSSEMLSSVLFFGAVFVYERWGRKQDKRARQKRGSRTSIQARGVPTVRRVGPAGGHGGSRQRGTAGPIGGDAAGRAAIWVYPAAGFLMSLAFYTRFQTGFAIVGFLIWMVWPGKDLRRLAPLGAGFLAGVILNTGLDYGFYHHWVCTPYTYFRVNIMEGKAASMGTSSFLVYIAVLLAVVLAPPLSIFLLFAGFRTALLKKLDRPIVLSVVCFIVGHCLVAHKEERFLFPILNVLPIIVGWGLPGLLDWLRRQRNGVRKLIKGAAWFSVGLNTILLGVLLITPYSQAIYFTWQLKKNFKGEPATIYSLGHTPFETEERLPFVFYESGVSNLQWKRLPANDSLPAIGDRAVYVSTTYNQIGGRKEYLDSLGYEAVFYSSDMLWGVNELLHSMKINTINDIWVLYKKK
jgi:GPI mannosyltransferase 3